MEQEINTAIKGLTRRVNLKSEHILILENALANPDVNDQIWDKYLNGNNTKMALKEGIYTAEMIKLLTLRAIIFPQTLLEFLTWINKPKKKDNLTKLDDFHYEIFKVLTTECKAKLWINQVEKGVKLIIPYLLENHTLVNEVISLLKSEKNLWGYYYIYRFSKYLDCDLTLMKNYVKQKNQLYKFKLMEEESWSKIRDELTIAWRYGRFKPITKYQVWVTLFDGLNESKFAVFFAHIAYDKVPKSIFSKVKKFSLCTNFHHQVYGINTTREVGSFEQFILDLIELGDINVKAKYVVILVILFGLGGFFSRVYLFPSKLEKSANTFFKNNIKNNEDKSLASLTKPNDAKNKIAEILVDKDKNAKLIASVINCSKLHEDCQVNNPAIKLMEKAGKEKNFSKTAKTITTLIDSLSGNDANKKKQMMLKIKKVLNDNTLDYNDLLILQKANDSVKKSWVNAIYIYQAKNIDKGIQPDGIITSDGKTEEILKTDLSWNY